MKLSIIIPVYNVEDTLDRCVESVLHQGIDDFEVILVDDGSTDRSAKMCDEWQTMEKHIIVIHQQNAGLSAARNAGIEKATGEQITFVDSDDYLKDDTYSAIMPLAEAHDIVEFPVWRFFQQMISLPDTVFTYKQTYWHKTKAYTHTYAWNKIYKTSLFDKIRFPVGRVFEDAVTFPLLLQAAKDICTTSKGLYYYTQNSKGITATAKGHELQSLLDGHMQALALWPDPCYYLHVLNIQIDVYEQADTAPVLPFKRINPFDESLPPRLQLKAILLNIFGVKGLCKITKVIHRWKKPRS